jgi:flagellar basal-body rod modification protein FlgD
MSITGTTGNTINPTTPTTNGGLGTVASTGTTDPLLDKNAFLKLMMTQMQNQDPLNPQDPSQYLGQLAQLTAVEQETNVAQAAQQTAQEQNTGTALQLLGHTVSYLDANGNQQTGVVQKIDFTTSGPSLTINGVGGIAPTAVNEVS